MSTQQAPSPSDICDHLGCRSKMLYFAVLNVCVCLPKNKKFLANFLDPCCSQLIRRKRGPGHDLAFRTPPSTGSLCLVGHTDAHLVYRCCLTKVFSVADASMCLGSPMDLTQRGIRHPEVSKVHGRIQGACFPREMIWFRRLSQRANRDGGGPRETATGTVTSRFPALSDET